MTDAQGILESLRAFKSRRDAVLHEDESTFQHHIERLVSFLEADDLIGTILDRLPPTSQEAAEDWWKKYNAYETDVAFPSAPEKEFSLRCAILRLVATDESTASIMDIRRARQHTDRVNHFRSVFARPFLEEMTHRLSEVARVPGPEARALQAVPLNRIPAEDEVRIFLSHKTVDKPLVYRFYHALKEVGFDPWLDDSDMPAGANLEREVYKGFEESCAAVFFITENFKDERFLAAEVEYAVRQKREKEGKFSIITLRFENAVPVPGLLTPYIYKDVSNDLDGFREIVRALPIELGPVRWKESVV